MAKSTETIEIAGRNYQVERNASGAPVRLLGKRAVYTLRVLDPQYEPDTLIAFQSNGRQWRERQKDGSFLPIYLTTAGGKLQVVPASGAGE